MNRMSREIILPPPDLQIGFAAALKEFRQLYLQDQLHDTVRKMNIEQIDKELSELVPNQYLALLASRGLRGEVVFAVPTVVKQNPQLIGYYRLLFGYSRKLFYGSETGLSSFQNAEDKGQISDKKQTLVNELCEKFIVSGCILLDNLQEEMINPNFLDDLTLLTVGPQFRGGHNVKIGASATVAVFNLISDIVRPAITKTTSSYIELTNAAGREVVIKFSSDPDIAIQEKMTTGRTRNIVAIEIKGGQDISNIHNRVGEAEKSHQKARSEGYTECWTVVNVDNADFEKCKLESPTTNQFFKLSGLQNAEDEDFTRFKDRIIAYVGISEHSQAD